MDIEQSKAEAEKLHQHGYPISDIISRLISAANHSGFERGDDHVALYFPRSLLMVSLSGASIYLSAAS
jgi:hypothetical protein